MRLLTSLLRAGCFGSLIVVLTAFPARANSSPANRLTYLDENDPFYVHLKFPKLTTPQWFGEPGVQAVVILAIDDLREPKKYETVLRPILERLKKIDGRAPVSIFCNQLDPAQAQFQSWLKEGLSLEVHTMTHPCPLLAKSNFQAAADVVFNGIELLNKIPNNKASAFRMPCCDSINSPSPRFYAEIFNRTSPAGQFLTSDSSVMNITTPKDDALPRELVLDADGREKFRKYLPFPSFVTTIEDYPYPYVIGKLCWEFPAMAPSDWEAQHVHGTNNPVTVADWKAALDATVIKQGVFTFIFHPHGWIRPDQMVEFIDYAVQKFGSKVKFLNFREAQERLDKNLLVGQPLRAANGQDNGVRLVDLNNDGYLDVVIGNEHLQRTRLWDPKGNAWSDAEFPTRLVESDDAGQRRASGVRFGVIDASGGAIAVIANNRVQIGTVTVGSSAPKTANLRETFYNAWRFDNGRWNQDRSLLRGLELDGQPVFTSEQGRDRGVRLRDVDNDGACELLVGNEKQNAIFNWSAEERIWKKLPYALPKGDAVVDAEGRDNGLRFVDINGDGYDDAIVSNETAYSLNLFVPKLYLGFQAGWTRDVITGKRGDPGEIPMIVRGGDHRNNGAWFHSRHLWVQNEDTATRKDLVDRRSFEDLLGGFKPAAKSPHASLEAIRVRPGFKVELVAQEPLVKDPTAFEWGPDGKLWVVEMGDYPLGIDGKGSSGGIVRFLEDTDGDGRYDKSTVFMEGVNFPNGIIPWRKGVIVSAAPEIFYAEDTNGDGKADVRKTLFRGFREGNQQHRANGFDYGLDNWLYGANGDSGGDIRVVEGLLAGADAASRQTAPVNLRGHDFRLRPDEGVFETIAGQTQFGRHRDDWGNWFGNNNPAWLWYFYLPEHYLARNPYLAVKSLKQYLANYPDSTRAFPISRTVQRFNDIGMVGHVTSANSATPYRDELFGPDFATSVFVSEPVHNLVHREVLEPDGASFTSHRAPDEQNSEFLASTDNWFRPVMMRTGPDGALYIADMYRFVIEHPEWIPPDTQKSLDLRAGHDMGRIYRVYPTNAQLRKIPRLDRLDTAGLVAALDSPNGWQRDTAQRLLVHLRDPACVPLLERLARESARPKTRLQALCALDGLEVLTPKLVGAALGDSHPAVRETAIRLSERFPTGEASSRTPRAVPEPREMGKLQDAWIGLVHDPSIRVRYQLALTLGQWPGRKAGQALSRLAEGDVNDSRMQTAVMSSALLHANEMLDTLFADYPDQPPGALLEQLVSLVASAQNEPGVERALREITNPKRSPGAWQLTALAGFLDAVERRDGSLANYRNQCAPRLKAILERLDGLFAKVRNIAADSKASEADRLTAIRLLGRGLSGQAEDWATLGALLRPQVPGTVQRAAMANLSRSRTPRTPEILLAGWRGFDPDLRNETLNILLSRSEWTEKLLEAVESGAIAPAQVAPVYQQKLLANSRSAIRERAQRLYAARTERKKVLQEYQAAIGLTGDSARGAALFKQNCATCHRFRGDGTEIGPDLGMTANKSTEALIVSILDPNQAVESRYLSYTAETQSGREVSGVIAAETPNSISIRAANVPEETILRSDLKQLTSSGMSLMPEGLETVLKPQDLADLIHYLTNPSGL